MNVEATSEPEVYTSAGEQIFDAAIIGGGLAGLSSSILLAKAGFNVVLFEKEKYPFHKVCGEYISLESWNFLGQLGLPLSKMGLPIINRLVVSAPDGKTIESNLDPGGFGISRYLLDHELSKIAKQTGVHVLEETKVSDVVFENEMFTIYTSGSQFRSRVAVAAFGKRSNLDIKWSRSFIKQKTNKLSNYIAVKHHVQTTCPPNTIALHNFQDGYCGISRIEDEKYCLCYLTTAKNLKVNNNSISEMEKNVLQKNAFLKELFLTSTFLYSSPVTISQISFNKKSQFENHVLMTGDAAGMITPLCGNGMSMALHSGKIAFRCIAQFLQNKIKREQMEGQYSHQWNQEFARRLRNGRLIQSLFGKKQVTNAFIGIIRYFPSVVRRIIRSTHGSPF